MKNNQIQSPGLSHGSLFSGIGGFDLAAKWMGWNNIFQVEKDNWCRQVLAKNFPETKRYSDIKDFSGYEYRNQIDLISGGFPCQPFSVAGQRKGKDDDRYLWAEMLRVVGEIKPTYVIGENVTGIIKLALDTVLSDLENQGYTTETFTIPACSKNAWHRRDRVWVIAYTDNGRIMRTSGHDASAGEKERLQKQYKMEQHFKPGELRSTPIFPNPESIGREQSRRTRTGRPGFENGCGHDGRTLPNPDTYGIIQNGKRNKSKLLDTDGDQRGTIAYTNHPGCEKQRNAIATGTELFAPKCGSWWETEPGMDRVVNGLPGRVDRLKGLGNAIVPQIAYEIFSAIAAINGG